MKHIKSLPLCALVLGSLVALGCSSVGETPGESEAPNEEAAGEAPSAPTSIEYSFVVMGCNRIGWGDDGTAWRNSEQYNEAHANIVQLDATYDDVIGLATKPYFFFFVGDMVLAENKDPGVLVKQLRAWRDHYNNHAISSSGIQMVAIPGNHEFLYSLYPDPGEKSLEKANEIWLKRMSEFIVGDNGPGKGGPDGLLMDESKLTYSLDHKGDHFVLMNTDTYDQPGMTPVDWITADVSTWHAANPDGHIFLLGHKPAYGGSNGAGGSMIAGQAKKLWDVMKTNQAEAMLSAHMHLFWAGKPLSDSDSWQVIAGNGGTTLDSGDFFGFTEVQVMKDGSVKAISHGRPVPSPDYGPLKGKTSVRGTYDLTWPGK